MINVTGIRDCETIYLISPTAPDNDVLKLLNPASYRAEALTAERVKLTDEKFLADLVDYSQFNAMTDAEIAYLISYPAIAEDIELWSPDAADEMHKYHQDCIKNSTCCTAFNDVCQIAPEIYCNFASCERAIARLIKYYPDEYKHINNALKFAADAFDNFMEIYSFLDEQLIFDKEDK